MDMCLMLTYFDSFLGSLMPPSRRPRIRTDGAVEPQQTTVVLKMSVCLANVQRKGMPFLSSVEICNSSYLCAEHLRSILVFESHPLSPITDCQCASYSNS
jgi:hypothetical protein